MAIKPTAQMHITDAERERRAEMEVPIAERNAERRAAEEAERKAREQEERERRKQEREETRLIKKAQADAIAAQLPSKGDNAQLLNFNMVLAQLPPVNINDREQVAERTSYYFAYCLQEDNRPNLASYGLALGIPRQEVRRILHGQSKVPAAVREIITKANAILDSSLEDMMMNGKINPVSGIFLMRNNHDYTNNEIAIVDKADPLGELRDVNTIKNKYKDIVDDFAENGAESENKSDK